MINTKISLLQFIYMIVGLQFGINTFWAPAMLAAKAGTDGWISLLLSGVASMLTSIVCIKVMEQRKTKTFHDFILSYFGFFFGRMILLLLSIYWLCISAVTFLYAVHIIQAWILPKTPNYSVTILYLIPAYLVLRFGLQSVSRYTEVCFYLTIGLGAFLLVPLRESQLVFLLPIYKEGLLPILAGAKEGLVLFAGFEASMLLYPHLSEKKQAIKGVLIANGITLLLFLFLILVNYVYYSPDEIQDYIWPSLNIFKVMEFPFVERFEIIFISYYLLVISTAVFPYFFFLIWTMKRTFWVIPYQAFVWTLLFAFGVLSFFYNPSYYALEKTSSWLELLSLIFVYAFPLFLLLYTIGANAIRRKHANSH